MEIKIGPSKLSPKNYTNNSPSPCRGEFWRSRLSRNVDALCRKQDARSQNYFAMDCAPLEASRNLIEVDRPPQSVFRRRALSKELPDEVPFIEQVLSRDDFDPPITWTMWWLKSFYYYLTLMVLLCLALTLIAGIYIFHIDHQKARVNNDIVHTKPLYISYLGQGIVIERDTHYLEETLGTNASIAEAVIWKDEEELKYYASDEHCVPIAPWQKSSMPSCNSVHEIDLPIGLSQYAKGKYGLFPVGRGGTRSELCVLHLNSTLLLPEILTHHF